MRTSSVLSWLSLRPLFTIQKSMSFTQHSTRRSAKRDHSYSQFFSFSLEFELPGFYCIIVSLACEQALLFGLACVQTSPISCNKGNRRRLHAGKFGRVKRVSRERASEQRSREGQRKGSSLARSREAHFACPNRRACPQAIVSFALPQYTLKPQTNGICVVMIYLYSFPLASPHITF